MWKDIESLEEIQMVWKMSSWHGSSVDGMEGYRESGGRTDGVKDVELAWDEV